MVLSHGSMSRVHDLRDSLLRNPGCRYLASLTVMSRMLAIMSHTSAETVTATSGTNQ